MNKTTATQLAQLVIKLDQAIAEHDAVCEQLTAHSIKHSYTREQARPAIVQYVGGKLGVAVNEKGQFVKPDAATGKQAMTKWEKARKRVQRILAPIYAEPKPVKRNKVDPVDTAYKAFASLTPAQAKIFLAMIQR